ncbi:MAG: barstar family protein [Nitrosomonadales bacterium]
MNTLCARLQDMNEAGFYRLNCPLDDLRGAVAQVGFALFDADLTKIHDKAGFLDVVSQAIQAPSGFGNNWDALADELGDLAWQPVPGYVLLLRNGGETLGLSVADKDIATNILADTIGFWRLQGKSFWVFRC